MKTKYFLYLLLAMTYSSRAFAWGELGHRIVAEYGSQIADTADWTNCHIRAEQIVSHTNDPDKIWRQQRILHRWEAEAHFFHVAKQPPTWRERTDAQERSQGYLVYRITEWVELAKKQRKQENWSALAETLYGLSHYLGDLTQPLHLHHDYDGKAFGIVGIHSQFETKMLNRYEPSARSAIESKLKSEKIPPLWNTLAFKNIIFDTAQQSFAKAPRLLEGSKSALQFTNTSKKRGSKRQGKARFIKKILWQNTGELAQEQLALGARLWARALNEICK